MITSPASEYSCGSRNTLTGFMTTFIGNPPEHEGLATFYREIYNGARNI
jgi:hypothetical protein